MDSCLSLPFRIGGQVHRGRNPHPDVLLAVALFVVRAGLPEGVFFLGACCSGRVLLAPAFLPAFLVPNLLVVGFFSEAAPLAVVFFVA